MSEALLKMVNIKKRFGAVVALNKVSLDLRKSEIHALCGENGAGKSTLMKILSGSYDCSSYEGEIYIDDCPMRFRNVWEAEQQGIEMIYQEISLHLDLSVAENIFLGNLPSKYGFIQWHELNKNAEKALAIVELNVDPSEIVRNLNTSQQQLITIARALSRNPKILVLDEPTSALTEKETANLLGLLKNLKNSGISCLYISHKLNEVFRVSDRITVIRDGEKVSTHDTHNTDENTLVEDMVGRKLENLFSKETAKIGEEVLRIEDFVVPHPFSAKKNIIDGVSFNVKKGEILGLAGLVGSGRSELFDAIFRVRTDRVSGKIYLNNEHVTTKRPLDSKMMGIGYLTEDRKRNGFIWTANVMQNLTLASFDKIFGKVFVKRKVESELAVSACKQLTIKTPDIDTMITDLSGGNQQKVVLAKWLMTDISLLLLDEPTRGIDVGAKAEIYKIITGLAQNGMAIIMVSSEMPELLALCDRILVLANGKIREELSKDEATQERIMKAAALH